jgi:hypothetical protein
VHGASIGGGGGGGGERRDEALPRVGRALEVQVRRCLTDRGICVCRECPTQLRSQQWLRLMRSLSMGCGCAVAASVVCGFRAQ